MTSIHQWRRTLAARLKPVAADLAAFESDCLLGRVLGCGPTELTLRAWEQLTPEQEESLERYLRRRLTGVPLAYVLGRAYFHGLELICDSRALIPRPETEELVEIALRSLPPPSSERRPLVIDIGTGSGNIALALASVRSDLRLIATDTELPSLQLADTNRLRLGLADRVLLLAGRTLSMFRERPFIDMIVANPPYIALGDPNLDLSVIEHEPHSALFAGPSGLEIISELLEQAAPRLVPGGWLISEIGYEQAELLRSLARDLADWEQPVLHRDLAGIERIMAICRAP